MSSIISNYPAKHQTVGLFIGPIIAIIMLLAPAPDGLSHEAWSVAAMGALMAIWWATEAIPIAITALLPLVFFPCWVSPQFKKRRHLSPIKLFIFF